MAKKALVTGACGFTGSNMVEHLLNNGWDVVATDLEKAAHGKYYCEDGTLAPSHYEDYIKSLCAKAGNMKFIPADLTDKKTLEPLFEEGEYDAVFHIASLYDYFAKWDVLYKVNVEGTRNLCELAVGKVKRFIHWSTDGVYGEIEDPPGTEDHPYNPPNLYSKSKVEQEKVVWEFYKKHGLPVTVLRPAPIYGPRHRYGVFHILYYLQKFGTGVVISWIPKSKTLMMPCVHVKDLVRAALFVAEKDEAVGEAYNVLSDCLPQPLMMEFLYRALGIPYMRVPVLWPVYEWGAKLALSVTKRLDARARARGKRPKVDVPMVEYVTHQYWFSNEKIKKLGFKFIYEDPRRGLWDFITWCKERGWLE